MVKNLITTSASSSSTDPCTQDVISSSAASLVFQFASEKSATIAVGIKSAARASASSDVCLNLKDSSAAFPGAGAAAGLDLEAAAGGGAFLTGALK